MKPFKDMLTIALLLLVVIHILAAMVVPAAYGKWLQVIDDNRYEYVECEGEGI
jgi:hypothetical protein